MASAPLPQGSLPRVSFEAVRPVAEDPLRTDVALFIGTTQRGPVMEPVRVEGARAYTEAFGELLGDANTPHALKAYFENGGRIVYVTRLAPGAQQAVSTWDLAADGGFAPDAVGHSRQTVAARTPGEWGNRLAVHPTYRRGADGAALFDFDIWSGDRLAEKLRAVPADELGEAVHERSMLIAVEPDAGSPLLLPGGGAGPQRRSWAPINLQNGQNGAAPTRTDYEAALEQAMELREPALIALPDLHRHVGEQDAAGVITAGARMADAGLDRMLVSDLPESVEDTIAAQAWLDRFANDPAVARTVAFYHPWLRMRDPLGTLRAPLRTMPPCGHVTGFISRKDRERGAYVTPANASLEDTTDLSRRPGDAVQGELSLLGINALRCQSGRGIVVWGGRLPAIVRGSTGFVAHRRFIHRLVRALRRVAAPLVFDPNDQQLVLAISRAATTLLMEAFHSGILKGRAPLEAFQVNVGPDLNDFASREAGRLICEIAIAPAVPMEFIHIRVGLSSDGTIDMVEA